MERLRARKSFRYATRHLQVGDVFDAKPLDARLLIAGKRAELAPAPIAVEPAPKVVEPPDERIALRIEYEKVFGTKPFTGWSADTLRERIAAKSKTDE